MTTLGRVLDRIYLGAAWLAGGLMIVMAALILYSVITRAVGIYAGGATNVAGYVMATSTFLALAYTFRSHGHIRVTLILNRLAPKSHRLMTVFCLGFMSLMTAYLAFYMARLTYDFLRFGERSQGADAILLWIPLTPVTCGATLFAVAVLHTFVQVLVDPDAFEDRSGEGPAEI